MHDEEDDGKQQIHPHDPARGDKLFAEDHDGGRIHGKQKQGIDEVTRQPHKKCRDRKSDLAEDVSPRNGNKKDDRAE